MHQRKLLLSTWLLICYKILTINRKKIRFIHRLSKLLNLKCSKLPTPKLDLYFRPYIQTTVRTFLPRVFSVTFCEFNTNSPWIQLQMFGSFGKNLSCSTQTDRAVVAFALVLHLWWKLELDWALKRRVRDVLSHEYLSRTFYHTAK